MTAAQPLATLIRRARLRLLEMHYRTRTGHIGGNLSCIDCLVVLHHAILAKDDAFLLSKGHSAGALYVAQWSCGVIDEDALKTFACDGTSLGIHPPMNHPECVPFGTGSLGHGPSLAAGMALGRRLQNMGGRVFCLCSDGEWQEGSCWEALSFAVHQQLYSLRLIVDVNGWQGFGSTRDVASIDIDSLAARFEAFGASVRRCAGHDPQAIIEALQAEQNMVSVAAGLARTGLRPWVYSIAPFCYARPFEQIRNDISLHDLPVRLLGNGAGYGYGVQGPSHHALEDCAVMGSLQNMRVYAPAFKDDLASLVSLLSLDTHPAYVRLGLDEGPAGVPRPAYEPFRCIEEGATGLILAMGTLAGSIWEAILEMPESSRPALWCCSRLPYQTGDFPEVLLRKAALAPWTLVVEEHVAEGGLGGRFARAALETGIVPRRFVHRHALGYPGSCYGSQEYHRPDCGLNIASLRECAMSLSGVL